MGADGAGGHGAAWEGARRIGREGWKGWIGAGRAGAWGRLGRFLKGVCNAHHAGIKKPPSGGLAVGRAGLVDYRLMPYVYPYIMSGCVIDWVNIVVKHCSATFPGAAFG